jgi:hypothetical protein
LAREFGMGDSTVNGNLTINGTTTSTGASTATAYTASSSTQFNCSKTDATCIVTSSTADATTSGTVGAITLKAGANITATDLLLDVQDSAGNHALTVTEAGKTVALSTVAGSGLVVTAGGDAATTAVCLDSATCAYKLWSGGASMVLDSNAGAANIYTKGSFSSWTASGFDLGSAGAWRNIYGGTTMRGTCALVSGTPSTCTATVTAAAICTCSPVGTTATIAGAGCAVSLSGTTLTITGPDTVSYNVNYHCIM